MRYTLGLPLALAAGIAFLSAPALADNSCPPDPVLTIKSLQGGGGNAARQVQHICATDTQSSISGGSGVTELYGGGGGSAFSHDYGKYSMWPEAQTKLRKMGW